MSMTKLTYDYPIEIRNTPDVESILHDFCANKSIGRVYSRYAEMSPQLTPGVRFIQLMDSLGFTGNGNCFHYPVTYQVKQWYGYQEDAPMVEMLLEQLQEAGA